MLVSYVVVSRGRKGDNGRRREKASAGIYCRVSNRHADHNAPQFKKNPLAMVDALVLSFNILLILFRTQL